MNSSCLDKYNYNIDSVTDSVDYFIDKVRALIVKSTKLVSQCTAVEQVDIVANKMNDELNELRRLVCEELSQKINIAVVDKKKVKK